MAGVNDDGVSSRFLEVERTVETSLGDRAGFEPELGESDMTGVDVVDHEVKRREKIVARAVSYTHLTLPTILLV